MRESAFSFHNLEWPPAGARLAGPVAWLRGWVVGKPGHDCIDLRVRHAGGTHLGVLGLPRTDLATHFGADRPWLPAEFIIGVPVHDGSANLCIEVMDAFGQWRRLQSVNLTIAPDGEPAPQVEGRLEVHATGTWTVRDAHHPFHGHLDDPGPTPMIQHGRIPVFGWLLDETRPVAAVLATTDTLVFNHLEHSLTDEALAIKVPDFTAARHARLRGKVDYPATLIEPACLRVYAVSGDGSVNLCFAQRLRAAAPRTLPTGEAAAYPALPSHTLPGLPSGRPRRLLCVLRALWPDDSTLRALDLTRHLTSSHRWAVRIVATEDGPLRQYFEQAGAESLIVNPAALFAAADANGAGAALSNLDRAIRWDHLDTVAVFDPLCGWALTLAGRRRIPTLFDCGHDEPLQPDPTASPVVQELLRTSWRSATALCFGFQSAATAQARLLAGCAAEIIPHWHSPQLPAPAESADGQIAQAPLRTADWLHRHHPVVAARWAFRQGPAAGTTAEQHARLDETFTQTGLQLAADWSVSGLALCLGPLFARGPIRPVLDALACGIPAVAARQPALVEILGATRLPLVNEANPLALAHALLARDASPDYLQRETSAAGALIRSRHSPAQLLPRWEELLSRVAATSG